MRYFVKTPRWLQSLFPRRVWELSRHEQKIYLTFDDGPHPSHTSFVLDELKKYNAQATFFCVGHNVKLFPDVYRRLLDEGHAVGNHTQHHLNGKHARDADYIKDVADAAVLIDSKLFRPPYGRIKSFQAKILTEMKPPYKIIMWTVLSGDFDAGISAKSCLENVLLNAGAGAIIVFHDSEKASEKLKEVLPAVLKSFAERGYGFDKITFAEHA